MQQDKRSSYRSFFWAFAAAFFVLSNLFLFLVVTIHPATPGSLALDSVSGKEALNPYTPTAGDALTVLFIGSQTGSSQAGSYILARFDPARGQVPIVVLPPQTMVENGEKSEPISTVYHYGGADYTRAALSRTLGIPIDRYVRISTGNFVIAANVIGSVEFDLPYALSLEKDGIPVTMSQGRQLLDGQKVLGIVTHSGYEGGEAARCRIAGELAAAIVNQRIDIVESTLMDKIFEKIINLVDTDISYADYDTRREAALFLAQLGDSPAFALNASGRWSEDEAQFVLGDTFLAQLRQNFV